MSNLMLYSGEVCEGMCGTPTDLYDDNGNQLFVGDQVVAFSNNYIVFCHGILVVVEDSVISDNKEQFIMGLRSIDFTNRCRENEKITRDEEVSQAEWSIWLVKSYKDCVEGEKVPHSAQIRYVREDNKTEP